jgi:hypothetical protein
MTKSEMKVDSGSASLEAKCQFCEEADPDQAIWFDMRGLHRTSAAKRDAVVEDCDGHEKGLRICSNCYGIYADVRAALCKEEEENHHPVEIDGFIIERRSDLSEGTGVSSVVTVESKRKESNFSVMISYFYKEGVIEICQYTGDSIGSRRLSISKWRRRGQKILAGMLGPKCAAVAVAELEVPSAGEVGHREHFEADRQRAILERRNAGIGGRHLEFLNMCVFKGAITDDEWWEYLVSWDVDP